MLDEVVQFLKGGKMESCFADTVYVLQYAS